TNGALVFLPGPLGNQELKVPQLRNLYEKTGFEDASGATTNMRGFGFEHDGAIHSIEEFVAIPILRLDTPTEQADMAAFLKSFPTGTAGGVGKQWTVRNAAAPVLATKLPVLEQQAVAGNLDLIIKGTWHGLARGFVFDPAAGAYRSDALGEA